jgi:hypothetical protein
MDAPGYELPLDTITVPPTLTGKHGRAWRITLDHRHRATDTIDVWLIEAPWAHPVWHSYAISLARLREGDVFYLPCATHELVLFALNPAKSRQDMLGANAVHILEPPNFAAQIVEVEDTLARERVTSAVEKILKGELSPDTDFRRMWIALFGNNMVRKECRE